jgi:hypothetical protein
MPGEACEVREPLLPAAYLDVPRAGVLHRVLSPEPGQLVACAEAPYATEHEAAEGLQVGQTRVKGVGENVAGIADRSGLPDTSSRPRV